MTEQKQIRLENIQLWRITACAMVLVVHLGQRLYFEGILWEITNFGAQGVYLFFIISGFLIANSYYAYGNKQTGRYIIRRLVKILPLYYIVILYYFLVHTLLLKDVPYDTTGYGWFRYLFMLHGIVPGPAEYSYFWQNLGITWTIPYFVFAYFTVPFFLKWVNSFRDSLVLFALLALVSLKAPFGGGWFEVAGGLMYFAEGVVLYHCFKEKRQMIINVLLCVLIILCALFEKIGSPLYSFAFMLLILSTEKVHIANLKIKKVLAISDRYSYTLYLAHGIVFIHILDRFTMHILFRGFIAVVGSALVTIIIKHCAEDPIQKFLYAHLENKTE